MAKAQTSGKYDYINPEESSYKSKVEPAGQYDNDFTILGIALQEIVQDKNPKAKVNKKNTKTIATSAFRRETLSIDLAEGMSIRAETTKSQEVER